MLKLIYNTLPTFALFAYICDLMTAEQLKAMRDRLHVLGGFL